MFKNLMTIIIISMMIIPLKGEDFTISNGLSDLKRDVRGRGRSTRSVKKGVQSDRYKYFFKSLLLPGWGEYELGNKNETKFFVATELGLIASAIGFYIFSQSRDDDFKEFAKVHAGINSTSYKEGYWINLGNYNSIDHYNSEKTRLGYADSRYAQSKAWYWDSEENRKKYDKIRISAENAETMSYYMLGGIFINHLISAINSGYEASKIKAGVTTSMKGGDPTSKLTFTYEF